MQIELSELKIKKEMESVGYKMMTREKNIEVFLDNAFWIMVNLRDSEYDEALEKLMEENKQIFQNIIDQYSSEILIDLDLVKELMYYPENIVACKDNILVRKNDIEIYGKDMILLRSKLLKDTLEYQSTEVDSEVQTENLFLKDKECWDCYLMAKEIYLNRKDCDKLNTCFELIKDTLLIYSKIRKISKNMFRLLLVFGNFLYENNDDRTVDCIESKFIKLYL